LQEVIPARVRMSRISFVFLDSINKSKTHAGVVGL
jgi:hypothetical protein